MFARVVFGTQTPNSEREYCVHTCTHARARSLCSHTLCICRLTGVDTAALMSPCLSLKNILDAWHPHKGLVSR